MDIHDGYNSEESDEATQEEMDALVHKLLIG